MPTADHAPIPDSRDIIPPIHNTITIIISSKLGDGSPFCPLDLVRLPNTAPAEYPANVKKIKANQLRMFVIETSVNIIGLSGLSGLFSFYGFLSFFSST
jgi:hypothetical protein